jgi:hypothetical protein
MTDKLENKSQRQIPATPIPSSTLKSLPKVDPAKTIYYRQDGIDRTKGKK